MIVAAGLGLVVWWLWMNRRPSRRIEGGYTVAQSIASARQVQYDAERADRFRRYDTAWAKIVARGRASDESHSAYSVLPFEKKVG